MVPEWNSNRSLAVLGIFAVAFVAIAAHGFQDSLEDDVVVGREKRVINTDRGEQIRTIHHNLRKHSVAEKSESADIGPVELLEVISENYRSLVEIRKKSAGKLPKHVIAAFSIITCDGSSLDCEDSGFTIVQDAGENFVVAKLLVTNTKLNNHCQNAPNSQSSSSIHFSFADEKTDDSIFFFVFKCGQFVNVEDMIPKALFNHLHRKDATNIDNSSQIKDLCNETCAHCLAYGALVTFLCVGMICFAMCCFRMYNKEEKMSNQHSDAGDSVGEVSSPQSPRVESNSIVGSVFEKENGSASSPRSIGANDDAGTTNASPKKLPSSDANRENDSETQNAETVVERETSDGQSSSGTSETANLIEKRTP